MIRRMIQSYRRRHEAALLPAKRGILGEEAMVGIDVGSAEGMQPHWRAYEGVVDFYLFEPHRESFEKLKVSFSASPYPDKFQILPVGLSAKGGERTLYMLNVPTGSSLCPINEGSEFAGSESDYIYPIRETRIQTRCLADVLDEIGVKNVGMIKLDVQGAELEILQGLGDSRRKNLLLVETEVNICGGISRNFSPYRGAPTWKDIDEMLVADGMRLLDISVARSYRARNGDGDWYQREVFDVYTNSPSLSAHVWEVDAVYVRDWRLLIADADGTSIRKLTLALCGYRFFSEAYFLIEKAEEAGVFDANTANNIKSHIAVWHRAGRGFWHARGGLWNQIRRGLRATGMSQLLRWKQYMWFDYPHG